MLQKHLLVAHPIGHAASIGRPVPCVEVSLPLLLLLLQLMHLLIRNALVVEDIVWCLLILAIFLIAVVEADVVELVERLVEDWMGVFLHQGPLRKIVDFPLGGRADYEVVLLKEALDRLGARLAGMELGLRGPAAAWKRVKIVVVQRNFLRLLAHCCYI